MQIEEMLDEDGFSSDDGSCLVDFRDFQFNQLDTKSRYFHAEKEIKNAEIKRKINAIRDKKNLLLDLGSTFSCCNNNKMLVNIRDSEKPINGVLTGGVLVTNKEGGLSDFSLCIITQNY